MHPEIMEAQKLYEAYELDRALHSLNKLSQGQIEELPIEFQLQFHTFKGIILVRMENYTEALVSAEKSHEIASKYEKFNDSIEKIDAFLLLAEELGWISKFEKSAEILEEVDLILNILPDKFGKLKKVLMINK